MSTRAASVAISQRAKQQLVNLLFKPNYTGRGPQAHRKLDASSYSYKDLRDAYLKRIQIIHPDKVTIQVKKGDNKEIMDNSKEESIYNSSWNDNYNWDDVIAVNNGNKSKKHNEFIELQEAWRRYEKIAKSMQKGKSESAIRGVQEDFTLFGVGCSFSDSLEEKHMRSHIMDQAGKGWCSAGTLSEFTDADKHIKAKFASEHVHHSLIDDDMFIVDNEETSSNQIKSKTKKSLVDHLKPKNMRWPKYNIE